MKRALITGVTGQDGSYLAELLLEKGYEVHGIVRRSSTERFERIDHLKDRMQFQQADLQDPVSLIHVVKRVQPDEVYNLAAQSFVPTSFSEPLFTAGVTALGVVSVLEALRLAKPDARFYQASSSEMFGRVLETPQTERTPFHPRSPYGVAKVFGHFITMNYRESYQMHASSGILFNHESERRGPEFVTRKVTRAAASIKLGLQKELRVGNTSARRDWGYAPDYVRAMWLMLQQDEPSDFVVSTGKSHTVQELIETAFAAVDMDWEKAVVVDPELYRPAEVDTLLGDATRAKELLGWVPEVDFKTMIHRMVQNDLKLLSGR